MNKAASRRTMLRMNVRQKDYYESRYEATALGRGAEERAANRPTRTWTSLRRRIQGLRAMAGVDEELLALHRQWLGDLRNARVLDLGCFTGNSLSLWLAESASQYVGIDLSEHAIAELNQKLQTRGLSSATGMAMDFLANDWPDGYFDVVYAYSVLHHFADIDVALAELHRLLKPGGIVVTLDPMETDPVNRLARSIYRPFQTDRNWEFPFSRATLRSFRRYFDTVALQGIQGTVKFAYPLLLAPRMEPLGRVLASHLRAWDLRHGRSLGPSLSLFWHVAMKLRRPDGTQSP